MIGQSHSGSWLSPHPTLYKAAYTAALCSVQGGGLTTWKLGHCPRAQGQ
ncbi:unnamed protein product [Staurois parvus]|uniref:Uncharacterized protein n=1 Tax=Staurois parvus TaxID=386267 RepID=A0ABN9ETD4_9NEOB|nr:unnamed protein product [Staurois parvus]